MHTFSGEWKRRYMYVPLAVDYKHHHKINKKRCGHLNKTTAQIKLIL